MVNSDGAPADGTVGIAPYRSASGAGAIACAAGGSAGAFDEVDIAAPAIAAGACMPAGLGCVIASAFAFGASPEYCAIGIFAGNGIDVVVDGTIVGAIASEETGTGGAVAIFISGTGASGGKSGIGGNEATPGAMLVSFEAPGEVVSADRFVGGAVGGVAATLSLAPWAHCGFALVPLGGSLQDGVGVSVVGELLAVDSGGISVIGGVPTAASPSGGSGAGPSLIFVNKNTPTATRIVIVMSGRIELIVRPP